MKTSGLTGAALDWAVAKCEVGAEFISEIDDPHFYSTDWAQGGPIIERERITVIAMPNGTWATSSPYHSFHHPTPLIAAMRCYVASKLGDEVELPEELNQ
jgi:hypothetical protein